MLPLAYSSRFLQLALYCFFLVACESSLNPITQAQHAFAPTEELTEEMRLARLLMTQDFYILQPYYEAPEGHPEIPLAPEDCDYCWFAYGYGTTVDLSTLFIQAKALLTESTTGEPCLEVRVSLPQSANIPPASLHCFLPKHNLKDAEGTDLKLWGVSKQTCDSYSTSNLGLTTLTEKEASAPLFSPYEQHVLAPPDKAVYRFFFEFSSEQDLVGPIQGDLTLRLEQGAFLPIAQFGQEDIGKTIETEEGTITLLGIQDNRVAFDFEGYETRDRIQVWGLNENGKILGPGPSFWELPTGVDPYQTYQLVYTRQNDFFNKTPDPTLPSYLAAMSVFYERFALPEQSIDNHLGRPFYLRRLEATPTSIGFYWLPQPDTLSQTISLSQ